MNRSRFSDRTALLITLLIGAAVGVIAGMFGVGGGALIIVGLLTLGFTQHAAHATSLAAIALTSTAALVPFALQGEVSILAAAVLAPAAMGGAYLGAAVMRRLPEDRLRQVFIVFVLLVALRMILGVDTDPGVASLGLWQFVGFVGLGLVAGVISATMGVGGGMVLIPMLVLFFGFGQHAAEGTSLAVVIPTSLVGAWRHSRSGYTSWRTGAILGSAGVLGGLGGATFALSLQGLTLQRLFGLFLVSMMVWLVINKRNANRRAAAQPPADPPADPAH